MKKIEPIIFAGDFSNEELYQWLSKKVEAMTSLRMMQQEKASLEERLEEMESAINEITAQSQLGISPTNQGPIHHPGSLEN